MLLPVCLILSSSDRGLLFGLSEGEAKSAVSTNCRATILHGGEHLEALVNNVYVC